MFCNLTDLTNQLMNYLKIGNMTVEAIDYSVFSDNLLH